MKVRTFWQKLAYQALTHFALDHQTILSTPITVTSDSKDPLHNQLEQGQVREEILQHFAYYLLKLQADYIFQLSPSYPNLRSLFQEVASKRGKDESRLEHLSLFYQSLLLYRLEVNHEGGHIKVLVQSCVQRKKLGAHYTPRALCVQTVQQTMTYVLDKLPQQTYSSEQLLALRICDPSLGGGAFLLELTEQLGQYLATTWLEENKFPKYSKNKVRQIAERYIVEQCLFGVDLDPQACFLARLSLYHKVGGTKKTWERLQENIQSFDTLKILGTNKKASSLNQGAFINLKRNGFDLIIGNPPYVSFYGRGSQAKLFPAHYQKFLQEHLQTIDQQKVITGRLNLFLSFMVLATKLLRSDTDHITPVVSFVLPDTIITNESYQSMRRVLTQSKRLLEVQHHACNLFEHANVGAAVILWGHPQTEAKTKTSSVPLQVKLKKFGESPQSFSETYAQILTRINCSWLPISSAELARLYLDGEQGVALEDFAQIRDGFNTGSATRRKSLLIQDYARLPSNTRACLEGKWITPHRITKSKLRILSEVTLSAPRFNQVKLVYRQTAAHIIAAVDEEGLCYLNSAHAIILLDHNLTVLYALCAYLNSDLFKKRYQAITGETRRTFPQVHVSSMKKMRVPRVLFDSNHELTLTLASHARQIKKLKSSSAQAKKHLQTINSSINQWHQEYIQSDEAMN